MDLLNQWIAWLSVDGNWIPVVVAGVIGLILGWLFTRIPARRRAKEYEAQISELNSAARNNKRKLDQAESESSDLTRQLNNVKSDYDKSSADLDTANQQISELGDEIAEKDAAIRVTEARGKAEANRILSASLTDKILKEKGIQATEELAKSTNTKIVVVGSGKDGLPLILGGNN